MNLNLAKLPFALILFCTTVLSSCNALFPTYHLFVTQEEANQLYAQGQYYNYIIIQDDFSGELQSILQESGKKVRPLRKSILSKIKDQDEILFLKGLIALGGKKYPEALEYFNEVQIVIPQAKLLMLDCHAKMDPTLSLYEIYQKIYDETTDKDMKALIKNHYRYYCHAL